jgi:hypothetical protein
MPGTKRSDIRESADTAPAGGRFLPQGPLARKHAGFRGGG